MRRLVGAGCAAVLACSLVVGVDAVAAATSPGDARDCADFGGWNAAQVWFETYQPEHGDVARLDSNGDGVACESLPGAPTASPRTSSGGGYWMLAANGTVFGFGDAGPLTPMVRDSAAAVAAAPDGGYWVLGGSGAVHARGSAHHGNATLPAGHRATAIAGTPDGAGYWIFTDQGAVIAKGAAGHHGDMQGQQLNGRIIAAAATPTGLGYWLVGSDGGIFTFGDAAFRGSTGAMRLNQPVVGIAPDPDGNGYWLVAADGGIFAFDAPFRGSVPGVLQGRPLNRPIVGALAYGNGYLMVASDGGIFSFSDRAFHGSLGATPPREPIVSVAVRPTTTPPDPRPAHRIGTRVRDGVGELYTIATGDPFVVRGVNYTRLTSESAPDGSPVETHSQFVVGRYDPAEADASLAAISGAGYNTVRVWLINDCASICAIDATTGELSSAYFENVADYLRRARDHGVHVVLTTGWLGSENVYAAMLRSTDQVQDINQLYLTVEGIEAHARWWRDAIDLLQELKAPMDWVLGYELRNELNFDGTKPPFNLEAGTLVAPNGRSYDLSDQSDKDQLIDDGLVHYADELRSAIREIEPTALVSASFFEPQQPNPARAGDSRIVRTAAVIARSTLDYVDIHAYPGLGLSIPQYMANFGIDGNQSKPIVMGEMGSFKHVHSSPDAGATGLVTWQRESCAYDLAGWMIWTWDTDESTHMWNAMSGSGSIGRALSPDERPDPCA